MRAQEGTARRYAKALHMAATEAGAGEAAGRDLSALLERAGFESVRFRLLGGGIVALHVARRPSEVEDAS